MNDGLVNPMNRKAFTLIELLVVVAIIGILAAVGVVAYNGYTASAKKTVVKSNLNTIVRYMFTNPKPILIHFNINETFSIIDALPLMDSILLSSISIYTIIDSICKDAMILPFLVGKKRYMYKYSHIHLTTFFYEQQTSNTLEDQMINLHTFRNKIIIIFKKYTKLPDKLYKVLFKRELFFDADTCLKYGFIDKII